MVLSALTVALAACASLVSAVSPNAHPLPPRIEAEHPVHDGPSIQSSTAATNGTGFFDQYIDHDNPRLGTFKQKYWWSNEFFAGPGSPVVLFTPGEIAAAGYEGYLTNRTLTGTMAQNFKGAVVMIEHRYYGESSPYADLTVKNLQYLNLKNAIADMTYFARTIKLPFDKNGRTNAPRAPWVLAGGSYSGALSAWTEHNAPGTFWAYHSSSAPVEAIYDYWQYFYPVQQGMPKNCSADVSKVVDYVDKVLTTGNKAQKDALKAKFGLGGLRDDDFAAGIENGPWQWQSNSFTTGYSPFYQWCDWVENAVDISGGVANGTNSTIVPPSAGGVGLEKALNGYAAYIKTKIVPGYCAGYGYDWTSDSDLGCFDTYNATSPQFTDISVGNAFNRQWNWFLCNEPFAYWQDGAPKDRPSIVSRLVTGNYWQRQCDLYFPTETVQGKKYTYASKVGKTVNDVNRYTGGWNDVDRKRLLFVNGEFDPWRTSGVSSQFRPQGPFQGTKQTPNFLLPNGIHCSDLSVRNWAANAGVKAKADAIVAQMNTWVGEFYHPHGPKW